MLVFLFFVLVATGLTLLVMTALKDIKEPVIEKETEIPARLKLPPQPLGDVKPVVAQSMVANVLPAEKKILQLVADQKGVKLEQILEEKNRIMTGLEEDLKRARSSRQEFESLQGILQQQIDTLKLQNKQLKDDLARAVQENIKLQAANASVAAKGSGSDQAPMIVHAAPDVSGLSLKDVFGEEPRKT